MALVVATLLLAWGFTGTVHALQDADLFHTPADGGGERGGVSVPDTGEPDDGDFGYFAFTPGMTFQTSDVTVTSRAMRRVATGHRPIAFVFDPGIVAFSVNVLGG